MASNDLQPIIIKKVKKAGHAHHGGAWKIAYADFVTAMMAFFLLLWLISMTTDEQKKGLADYFAPASVSESNSGAGGVLGGTALDEDGAKQASASPDQKQIPSTSPDGEAPGSLGATTNGGEASADGDDVSKEASANDLRSRYDQEFQAAAASIRQAFQAMPNITDISDSLLVQETEDGLSIILADQEGRPMFPEGSKFPFETVRKAIATIAPVLRRLPNAISISGHTAAGGTFTTPGYGPWDLSADRANVVRTILGEFGLGEDRIESVVGRAATEPFFPNDPYLAANERVVITVLYDAPPVPPGIAP